jgi:hypothetical protein
MFCIHFDVLMGLALREHFLEGAAATENLGAKCVLYILQCEQGNQILGRTVLPKIP